MCVMSFGLCDVSIRIDVWLIRFLSCCVVFWLNLVLLMFSYLFMIRMFVLMFVEIVNVRCSIILFEYVWMGRFR